MAGPVPLLIPGLNPYISWKMILGRPKSTVVPFKMNDVTFRRRVRAVLEDPGRVEFNQMTYRYTGAGLPNIYLRNGYTVRESVYGQTVSFDDVHGLHRAIGLAVVGKSGCITREELRFLRKELGLSQRELAALVGSSEQTVSLWERNGKTPRAADLLVRLLYTERAAGHVRVGRALRELAGLDAAEDVATMQFETADGGWRDAA